MTNAGTEIGVASTKAFTTQLTVLLMLVAKLSRLKGLMPPLNMTSCMVCRRCRAVLSRCCLRTNALKRWQKISLTNITRCSRAVAISTNRAGRRIEVERDLFTFTLKPTLLAN